MNKHSALIILAKHPVPGQVKTRIAKDSSPEEAARIQHCLLQHIIEEHKNQSYRLLVWVRQPEYLSIFQQVYELYPEDVFLQQWDGLWDVMEHAIQYGLIEHNKVILMWSDIPDVTPENIQEWFFMLDNYDIILWPTIDGWYRSLWSTEKIHDYLSEITYSTNSVFDETVELFKKSWKSIATLPTKMDIDTWEDRLQIRERFET